MNSPAPKQPAVSVDAAIGSADSGKWPSGHAGQILALADKVHQRDKVQDVLDDLSRIMFGDRAGMLQRAQMYNQIQESLTHSIDHFDELQKNITYFWEGDAADAFKDVAADYKEKATHAQHAVSGIYSSLGQLADDVAKTWTAVIHFIIQQLANLVKAAGDLTGGISLDPVGDAAAAASATFNAIAQFISDANDFLTDAINRMNGESNNIFTLRDHIAQMPELEKLGPGLDDTTGWKPAK